MSNKLKSCEPSHKSTPGESMEEFLARKNATFFNYVAERGRPHYVKNVVKAVNGMQVDSVPPAEFYDSDQYLKYFSEDPVTPQFPKSTEPFDNSILKAKPQGVPFETVGLHESTKDMGSGPFGPYSPESNKVPDYVKTHLEENKLQQDEKKNFDAGKMKGAASGLGSMIPNTPNIEDILHAFTNDYNEREAKRKERWLDRQQTIENIVPVNYGSRGDYDVNQGSFRPDQRKQGGEPRKAFWGALISLIPMIMGQKQKAQEQNMQQQQMAFTQQQAQKKEDNAERMNFLAGAQNFQPSMKMGGSKKCYKKGGSYKMSEEQIWDAVSQGYQIEFEE
jgi:hypothetical protein